MIVPGGSEVGEGVGLTDGDAVAETIGEGDTLAEAIGDGETTAEGDDVGEIAEVGVGVGPFPPVQAVKTMSARQAHEHQQKIRFNFLLLFFFSYEHFLPFPHAITCSSRRSF